MPNVPLNPDETIIRQYHAAVLKTFKCHAYLTVTNQRLVISGHRLTAFGSVRSRISQQVSIASVSGVFSGYTRVTDWLKFGVCFLALSLGRYAYVAWLAAEKYIAMTGADADTAGRASALVLALAHPATVRGYFSGFGWHGAFFLIVSYLIAQRWLFALRLHTAAASAPISLGEGYGSKSALLGLRGQPTSQSEKLTCELGQLVEDVRLNGDEAIARWAQKGKAEESFRRAA
jgi:hypothetical protein